MNEKCTAIVITTKLYPTSSGWIDLPLPDSSVLNYQENLCFLDFDGKVKPQKAFCDSPSMKKVDKGRFMVYVCPCLCNNEKARAKSAFYLEQVVETVMTDIGQRCNFDYDFILVAHDKDFVLPTGENGVDGIVAEKGHFTNQLSKCPHLKRLVDNRHVFMFQHGYDFKLGGLINSEKFNLDVKNQNCLSENDCQEMFDIISEETNMRRFFASLAQNPDFVHPQNVFIPKK